jgi:Na+:H+ antiporter, NhaA family
LIATCGALLWAKSPLSESYGSLWTTEITLRVGAFEISDDLRPWINDGLMTVLLFVVGLETKRDLVAGELRGWRIAALPATAARRNAHSRSNLRRVQRKNRQPEGLGHPDGDRHRIRGRRTGAGCETLPSSLKTLLLGIAIVDDIGAPTVN